MFSTKRLKHLCPVPLGLLSSLSRSLEPRKQFFFGLLIAARQPLESDDRIDNIPIDPGSRRHL